MTIPTCPVCGENPCLGLPECIDVQAFPPTRAELADIVTRLVRIEELLGVGVKVTQAYRCGCCGLNAWPGAMLPMEPDQLVPHCPNCGGLFVFCDQPELS